MTNKSRDADRIFQQVLKTIKDNKDNTCEISFQSYLDPAKKTLSYGEFEKRYERTKRIMYVLTRTDSRHICDKEINERFNLFDFIIANKLMTLGHIAQNLKEQVTELHRRADKSSDEKQQKKKGAVLDKLLFDPL